MRLTTLWTEQYPRPEDLQVSELPTEVDIAIVGSGYTGLHAALVAVKYGASVAVLEKETIGWGASSRNGSMLTPGLKAKSKSIKKKYGSETAQKMWRWALDAIYYVRDTVEEEKIDCDFKQTGNVYLATKESHAEGVKSYGEYLKKEFDFDTHYLSKEDVKNEIGSKAFFGGLLNEESYRLQPAKYVFGLAEIVARKGVKLVENAEVVKVLREAGGFRLITSKGEILAKKVLMATGGYTTNVVPKVRSGIFPVGSYIIVTEPLSESMRKELSPNDRVFYDSKIFLNYFSMTADGRFMLGGRANLSPTLDVVDTANLLHKRILGIFPQLEKVPISHAWTGRLGISFDQMPHIGNDKGLYYAYGYSGHGVSIASYLGREVGELMAGKRETSMFSEINHPRTSLARLDSIYLPIVSAYFKMRDTLS